MNTHTAFMQSQCPEEIKITSTVVLKFRILK